MDIKRFLNVWQQDAQQIMPLSPANFPKVLTGKEAIYNQYKSLPGNFTSMRFPREIYPTSNPDVVIVKYAGIIPLKSGGTYNNNYVGIFELKNGKISTFTEYFDPVILSETFGMQLESNFNVKTTEASVEKVSFISEGLILKGNLYLPAGFDASKQYPAVIVTGSWTSVKEQMAGLYAQKLAQQGFVALAFDFRYWGESEGQPRQYENPEAKTIDIKNAATYLLSLPYVNSNELSGLSICASAGYMAKAVSEDTRIKKLVTVAGWLHTPLVAKMIYDNWPDKYEGLIAKGNAAAEKFRKTGTTDYVVACSDTNPNAAMYVPNGIFPYYIDPALGAIPEYTNNFALMSWPKWLQYDAIASSHNISQPVYMIHSEKAALPDGARQFYSNLKGSKKTEWINEYSQMEFYYKEDAVNTAVTKAAEWLKS
ncbi:hypothetical protein CHU92_11055 [Flavobacterium cyanobacteriorum]|uniref:SnoaL-like domain-containing protein n=1 Tax=Flavobacterium cyanobacteriorum TaxID=2022802 RepID=A0A255Z370_9FLAO|nr:nuclear transport factor 2 family protein [Flavobacterium cyanobacteriorum]OYQ35110.1 hypothetical protein CHU92_11055 [Flavobacterium cyanobacteriorum]